MKVGFIGVGNMGSRMAANLLEDGTDLTVYDINPESSAELGEKGADVAASPAELARRCELVFCSLPTVPASHAVLLGEHGVIAAASPGTIIVDQSTVDLETSRACARAAEEAGCRFLDAPVSGGAEGAADATLSIMVGGDEAVFERAKPYFETMGSTVVLMGAAGAGTTTKLINQLLVGSHSVAAAEAFTLAREAGLDITRLVQVLMAGWAGSTMLDRNAPITIAREFEDSPSPLRNVIKDLKMAGQLAETLGVVLPVADAAAGVLYEADDMGYGPGDPASGALVIEKRSREAAERSAG